MKPIDYQAIANSHPKLAAGMAYCHSCERSQHVNSGAAPKTGWPKCCGYTMSLDTPEDRRQFKEFAQAAQSK